MIFDNMDNKSPLYRYIDLPQLFSLLLSQSLFFPAITSLPDRNEFIDHDLGNAIQFFSEKARTDKVYRDTIPEKEARLKRKIEIIRGNLFLSCWSTNFDDYALWRIYTKNNQFGFMIESTVGNVLESLTINDSYNIFHKAIDYAPYSLRNVNTLEKLLQKRHIDDIVNFFPFMKIENYHYEQEYRFIIYDKEHKNENGLHVKCDLSKLIMHIHYSPFMPMWFKNEMDDLKFKFIGGDMLSTVKTISPLMQLIKSKDTTKIREI